LTRKPILINLCETEHYADYDDLRCAAIEAWQKAALDPEIIKSVCRAKDIDRNY